MEQSGDNRGPGTQFLIQKIVQHGNAASVMASIPSSQEWEESRRQKMELKKNTDLSRLCRVCQPAGITFESRQIIRGKGIQRGKAPEQR